MGNGEFKNATLSVWSMTQRHPTKSETMAQALVTQKPDVDKLIIKFGKQVLLYGATKNKERADSILDYMITQFENTDKVWKMIHEESIQLDD
eukprot:12425666-Ditylum_brightwellii.AAC.1